MLYFRRFLVFSIIIFSSLLNASTLPDFTNIVDENIIDKIDDESGYKTDENFFQWLFKGKSKR